MKKTIAIVCDGSLESQPRVLTEINSLNANYNIVLLGERSKLDLPFYKLHILKTNAPINFHLKFPVLVRKFFSVFISGYLAGNRLLTSFAQKKQNINNLKLLMSIKPNLVIMHGMPHCKWVTKATTLLGIPIVINSHEYYPLEFEDNKIWMKDVKPVYDRDIKTYFSIASSHFVVCNSIIKKYKEEFNLKNQILVRNAKPFYNIEPSINTQTEIKMIHHGICNASRHLELTIDAMKYLPKNYTLDFMLIPDKVIYPKLIELAKHDYRIKFIPPVPTKDIVSFINSYDLGLFLLPPVNFNYLNALPNKLFEYIQARLAIVVSPNPEMKALVKEFEIGTVSKDYTPQEFAKAILIIDKNKLQHFKNNADKAAAIINDESEQKKILKTVNEILCAE